MLKGVCVCACWPGGGGSYIRPIVPLPQLHMTFIDAATRLCFPSGPPPSQQRNRLSAVSKYGRTQWSGTKPTHMPTYKICLSGTISQCLTLVFIFFTRLVHLIMILFFKMYIYSGDSL